jgi:DNA polymerase I-like protein with 3'-5' exonuclease and polymerase domains
MASTDYCAVDCETTYIRGITKDVEKVWMIGWYYKDIHTGEFVYDHIDFPEGMEPELLANHVVNAGTLAILSKSQELYYDKLRSLRDILAGDTPYVPVFHNAGFDVHTVLEECGFTIPFYHDTMIAAYVLFPPSTLGSLGDDDAMRFYSLSSLGGMGLCSAKLESPTFSEFTEAMVPYNRGDCIATHDLANLILPALTKDDKANRAYNLDRKMVPIVSAMQATGTKVDKEAIAKLAEEVTTEIVKVDALIKVQVGGVLGAKKYCIRQRHDTTQASDSGLYPATAIGYHVYEGLDTDKGRYAYRPVVEFNANSSAHRAIALRKLCGWVPSKFSRKTNEPTCDKSVLHDLSESYEFARQLLTHSKLSKLVSTYIPAFTKTDYQSRIHPSFLLTATRTGRLSSREPNFQNIPKEACRDFIVAREGYKLVVVDLSQIELRILAFLAATLVGNYYLWGLYAQGADVHSSNMKLLETTNRRLAKNGIFLKIYGGGAGKLAATLGIPLQEAKDKLELMNERMPFIDEVSSIIVKQAYRSPSSTIYTMYGHKLCYPYLKSDDREMVAMAKRQLFNGTIQGTQSDIIKLMMCILWYDKQIHINYGARFLMQVHDELVFEVPESNTPIVMDIIDRVCTNKTMLPGLPIIGISGCGDTWKSASEHSEMRAAEYTKATFGT